MRKHEGTLAEGAWCFQIHIGSMGTLDLLRYKKIVFAQAVSTEAKSAICHVRACAHRYIIFLLRIDPGLTCV